MRTRTKKMLSLLLAASMVFTMNTFAFAEEIVEDDAAVVEEAAEVVADDAAIEVADEIAEIDSVDDVVELTDDTTVTPNAISGDKVLSENLATIEANLDSYLTYDDGGDYVIAFETAVAFDGKNKLGNKNLPEVKVYKKANKTVSGGDLVSDNGLFTPSANNTAYFTPLEIKKIQIKAAKGATVKLDGTPLFEAKKSTFIKGIKLKDKNENKAFQTAMKEVFKKANKSVEKVSANGLADGKVPTSALFTIAVYPCYVGNDDTARVEAQKAGLEVGDVDDSKSKFAKPQVAITNAAGKKKKLKLTTKDGKFKGLDKAGKQAAVATDNSVGATSYYIADGDYAGNIYFK